MISSHDMDLMMFYFVYFYNIQSVRAYFLMRFVFFDESQHDWKDIVFHKVRMIRVVLSKLETNFQACCYNVNWGRISSIVRLFMSCTLKNKILCIKNFENIQSNKNTFKQMYNSKL